jgi:hypothetical protein
MPWQGRTYYRLLGAPWMRELLFLNERPPVGGLFVSLKLGLNESIFIFSLLSRQMV